MLYLDKPRVNSTILLSWQRKNTTPVERLSAAAIKIIPSQLFAQVEHASLQITTTLSTIPAIMKTYGADVSFLQAKSWHPKIIQHGSLISLITGTTTLRNAKRWPRQVKTRGFSSHDSNNIQSTMIPAEASHVIIPYWRCIALGTTCRMMLPHLFSCATGAPSTRLICRVWSGNCVIYMRHQA